VSIWTLGYAGRTLDEIAALIGENGRLLDIRLNPYSRVAAWCFLAFRDRFGERYRHVRALGNLRYKLGPPVEIADFDLGRAIVAEEALGGDVFLMCACREIHGCHRKTVSELLRAEGLSVAEVIWPSRPGKSVSHL
jgi:uncharacterized protein (DUF488 family)